MITQMMPQTALRKAQDSTRCGDDYKKRKCRSDVKNKLIIWYIQIFVVISQSVNIISAINAIYIFKYIYKKIIPNTKKKTI